ncbi:CbtA family protein [Nocardioides jiangxiensis]|uniref:CbtA family protein n=1 Tax=Nocardioides jiangxiensis TaxID=3064524 RepID=A0ABT9AZV2_9ACTN|nr:CbtA family protein [Nocardioides sp. WY-20]MDO7867982.1 CbtA family protein [Nocardioides sp. WY-20]
MSIGDLLRRGLAAGAAAGCLAAVWLLLITERSIKAALRIEDARNALAQATMKAHQGHVHAEDELVTHDQQIVFAVLALVVVGALLGLVFAVVYAAARTRLPGYHDTTKALALGGIAFFAVTLFPFIAIPGNPPAVGDPSTINERTVIYLGAISLGILLVLAAFALDKALVGQVHSGLRTVLVLAFVVLAGTGLQLLIPNTPDAIQSKDFALQGNLSLNASPELIWNFRMASLGQYVVLWGALAAFFGALITRKAEQSLTADRETVSA